MSGIGGEQSHVQTAAEMAFHYHDLQIDTSSGGYMAGPTANGVMFGAGGPTTGGQTGTFSDRSGTGNSPNFGAFNMASNAVRSSGNGNAANILPPVSVVNWFIVHGK